MSFLLSICIPTYNRGKYINATLASITSQITSNVEIVISDNSSTDNTLDIIREYQEKYTNIHYVCSNENVGADRNYLKVIEIAKGNFCWFVGSDDVLEPGAIEHIIKILQNNSNVAGVSVNRYAYDLEMNNLINERPICGGKYKKDYCFEDSEIIFSSLGEYFGYIGGQIVNRSLWNEVVENNNVSKYFNAFVHVYVIGKMIQKNSKWIYCSRRCIGWRSGNDSFLSEGIYKRLEIDVIGYKEITIELFGSDSWVYRKIMNIFALGSVRQAIMSAKANNAPFRFFYLSAKLAIKNYHSFPLFWIKTFPIFFIPCFIMRFLRFIYRNSIKPIKETNVGK